MAVITSGITAADIATIDPKNKALRVTNRPIISSTLGSYAVSLNSGVMAAALAANASIWGLRYGGTNICAIEKVVFDGLGMVTGMTAAQGIGFGLFITRACTVGVSIGTAAVLTGNNGKLRTSYATTGVGNINISTTAALTAGTRTPDAQPMGALFGSVPITTGALLNEGVLFDAYKVGHPIILVANEGIELQNRILWGAGGTWTFGITVQWSEYTAAEWEV